MKTTLTLIINLLLIGIVRAQCAYDDIFPLSMGISKFKAMTGLATIVDIKEYQQLNNSWWENIYDPKGDSVYFSASNYYYLLNPCFKGAKNELLLKWVDDRLYKMEITLSFLNTDLEKCIENYNLLMDVFKTQFPKWSWTPWVKTNTIGNIKEQIGEGYWISPPAVKIDQTEKKEEIEIGYEIDYETKWNGKESSFTGNVKRYKLKVTFVNLKGTRLTNKGY